jgi:hypothetical protein
MTGRPPDPRAAAIRQYTRQAVELRAEVKRCREEGYGFWAYEFEGLAMIAERAAVAEIVDKCPR